MTGPRVALAILRKDLLLDLRSRDRVGHMAMFAALIVVLLAITGPPVTPETAAWLPALVWIVFLLVSLLGLARAFQSEVEEGAIVMLTQVPCDRGWVYLGKAGANAATLFLVQLWTAALFGFFLEVPWERAPWVGPAVGLLGAVGLSAIGTLLAAMSVAARFPQFLLPVLMFPLILPVLIVASRALDRGLSGEAVPGFFWGALVLYDWIVLVVGYLVFDYVLEE